MPVHIGGHLKDLDDLPQGDLPDHAVRYKEATNLEELAEAILPWYGIILLSLVFLLAFHIGLHGGLHLLSIWGLVWFFPMVLVHEGLHLLAMPRKAEKYLYWKPEAGTAMVTTLDPMSPARFIYVSALPFVVLGVLPVAYGVLAPLSAPYTGLAFSLGSLMAIAAAGDLYNIYNTLTQVPKGAMIQLSGMHTYWYLP